MDLPFPVQQAKTYTVASKHKPFPARQKYRNHTATYPQAVGMWLISNLMRMHVSEPAIKHIPLVVETQHTQQRG